MKSHFGKMGKFGGVGGISGTITKYGGEVAMSYIIVSLLLLSCYYFFITKISKNYEKTAQGFSIFWICCSFCVALLIFGASKYPPAAYSAAIGCGLTLTVSSIICSCTYSVAGGF
jgi:hypothetical protein